MSVCWVPGCESRLLVGKKVKFYRIPSSKIPFQANRRRLWLEAISRGNDRAGRPGMNARICGAHFVSGRASMDQRSVDFVPSVFPIPKPAPGSKRKRRRLFGRRKRGRLCQAAGVQREQTPPGDDDPVTHQPPVVLRPRNNLLEEVQIPAASKEVEKTTKAGETEAATEATKPEPTSPGAKTISSIKLPAGVTALIRTSPVVLLKPLVTPAGSYQCELCDQTFAVVPQFVNHRRQHEEERPLPRDSPEMESPSDVPAESALLPCNMCDRSFTSAHNLKRHKLLHVKDGRKCPQCGVLFCRRHNHVLFLPRPESAAGGEEKPQRVGAVTRPVEARPEKPAPSRTEEAKSSGASTPTAATADLEVTSETLDKPAVVQVKQVHQPQLNSPRLPLPASFTSTSVPAEIPVPMLKRPLPPLPPCLTRSEPPNYPADFVQPHLPQWPKLPPSLQIFTPQRLTSAFLEVHRNYDYILSKRACVHNREVVKKEPPGTSGRSPEVPCCKHVRPERTAYDLEIVL